MGHNEEDEISTNGWGSEWPRGLGECAVEVKIEWVSQASLYAKQQVTM